MDSFNNNFEFLITLKSADKLMYLPQFSMMFNVPRQHFCVCVCMWNENESNNFKSKFSYSKKEWTTKIQFDLNQFLSYIINKCAFNAINTI